MSSKTKAITQSGVMCALYIVILLTGLIPGLLYISIAVAIGSLHIIKSKYGTKQWCICYIASSLLSLILVPDLEVSLTCICMGWYPEVRDRLKNKNKVVRIVVKTIIFLIASSIIYQISIFVFGGEQIIEEIPFFSVFYAIIFTVLFYILDLFLNLFEKVSKRYSKLQRGMQE